MSDRPVNTVATLPARGAPPPLRRRTLLVMTEDAVVPHPLPARGAVTLGRGRDADLRVDQPSLSRRHLRIDLDDQRLTVTDLDSANGTTLRGVRLPAGVAVEVAANEPLGAGDVTLVIQELRAVASAPGAPAAAAPSGRLTGPRVDPIILDAAMQRLHGVATRVARGTIAVLLVGETGTGKEVLAEAMHEHSPRASKPYVILDCTTLPANLIEAELFGHERGSFTGAVGQRRGVFEEADGGTLFIDEIGDLDISLQPKLLRVLERGELRRVGGAQRIRVDVRVIAATRRDLDQAVETGAFRDDLFHRLAVGRLTLPPLRKRQGDIAFLAQHFWRELAPSQPLPAALLARWEAYAWPGNVRELRNTIARQIATGGLEQQSPAPADQVTATPEVRAVLQRAEAQLRDLLWSHSPIPITRVTALDVLQRAHVERALLEHGGSIDAAARSLGVGKRYLHMLKAGARKR